MRKRTLVNALGVVVSKVEAVTAGAAASFTGTGGGGSSGNSEAISGGSGFGGVSMSSELLDSLSKRLTTPELRGIIQLQERCRRLEDRAGSLQAEKEDLFARLQVER